MVSLELFAKTMTKLRKGKGKGGQIFSSKIVYGKGRKDAYWSWACQDSSFETLK